MTNKIIFSSKKYVILSWYMLLLIIWIAFVLCFYFLIDDLVAGIVVGFINFILMFISTLKRFWYINMYKDYIEIKHVFIPFFRRRFDIKQIRSIIFRDVTAGVSSASGMSTYIPCMILDFEDFEKKSKTYWNVISFYKDYHKIVYENWDKIKSSK